jgi:DNA-binding HxlR family transcriptional regulator
MCDPYETLNCPVDPAFKLLGRRWCPEVLLEINNGYTRFSQLQRILPSMSPRTLSLRISELETAGVIWKKNGEKNIVNYGLTQKGEEMLMIFKSIAEFSFRWYGVNLA